MNRVDFLAELHRRLNPRGYLEIGVGDGETLRLASCPSLGIEPDLPHDFQLPPGARIADLPSDEFFAYAPPRLIPQPLDLVFCNGSHQYDVTLRELRSVERFANPRTVAVVDGVLPRSLEDATRRPETPTWVGDVWQIHPILAGSRPDLHLTVIDVPPAGLLLIQGLDPIRAGWQQIPVVPDLEQVRVCAVAPEKALAQVEEGL